MMLQHDLRPLPLSLLFCLAAAAVACSTDAGEKPRGATFDTAAKLVHQHFAAQKDYRPGDLITRDQIMGAMAVLRKAKLKVPSPIVKEWLAASPAPGEFLPRQLRTPRGRRFMRRITGYATAYDRLDRLSRLPDGRSMIQRLIQEPGGHEMIQYLTQAPGGKNLGRMLSRAPRGVDFNKPTGRIYTEADLLARLRKAMRPVR